MNIVTNISELSFSSELSEIYLTDTREVMQLHIIRNKEVLFDEEFVPDSRGTIHISGLQNVLESYLEDSPISSFEFLFISGAQQITKYTKVIRCRAELGVNARTFVHQSFLSLLRNGKDTHLSSREYLYVYPIKETAWQVDATYRNTTSHLYEHETIIGNQKLTVDEINTLDVSPSLFEKEGKTLTSYRVVCGSREMVYWIDTASDSPALELMFANNFGLAETFSITGLIHSEDIYNDVFGSVRGNYRKFSSKFYREYTANTGVMRQCIADWIAADLFTSMQVYTRGTEKLEKRVTITDQIVKRSSAGSELPSYEFKYRLEQNNQSVYDFSRYMYSVWSKEFNNVFRKYGNYSHK